MKQFIDELSAVWNQFSPASKGFLSTILAGKKDDTEFAAFMDQINK